MVLLGRDIAVGLDLAGIVAGYEVPPARDGTRVMRFSSALGSFRNEEELNRLLDRTLHPA